MDQASVNRLPRYGSIDGGPPPSYENRPQTLVLDGQNIFSEAEANSPLYRTSRVLTTVQQPSSSIHLERVDSLRDELKSDGDSKRNDTQNQLVFYLVHPVNARWREDVPEYFATGSAPGGLGNLILNIQKKKLQKPEFRVTLSKGRGATSQPLFDNKEDVVLFTTKSKMTGNRYIWTDETGKTVATENVKKGQSPRLEMTECLDIATRDALVAVWCLRVWSDVAETREAKQDALERLTPAEAVSGIGMNTSKRTTALAGVAGAVGGG